MYQLCVYAPLDSSVLLKRIYPLDVLKCMRNDTSYLTWHFLVIEKPGNNLKVHHSETGEIIYGS